MSAGTKLSFRARTLDPTKALPVYRAEDLPDLDENAVINRSVVQLPTGVAKEEEDEHHLQAAISASQTFTGKQVYIPTPDTLKVVKDYSGLYPGTFVVPVGYVRHNIFDLDPPPPYDMDEEDADWLAKYNKEHGKNAISELEFEYAFHQFEESTSNADGKLITAKKAFELVSTTPCSDLYAFWYSRRSKKGSPLNPVVKIGKAGDSASAPHDAYVAFRRWQNSMVTRKNRKNDEGGYERMLKLRRGLKRARDLMDLIRQRELQKRDMSKLSLQIFNQKFKIGDWKQPPPVKVVSSVSGSSEKSLATRLKVKIPKSSKSLDERLANMTLPEQQAYLKRKSRNSQLGGSKGVQHSTIDHSIVDQSSSEDSEDEEWEEEEDEREADKDWNRVMMDLDDEDDNERYVFRWKRGCSYRAPRLQFYRPCTQLLGASNGGRFSRVLRVNGLVRTERANFPAWSIERRLARKRIGRGGRTIFDFGHPSFDDEISSDEDVYESVLGYERDSANADEYRKGDFLGLQRHRPSLNTLVPVGPPIMPDDAVAGNVSNISNTGDAVVGCDNKFGYGYTSSLAMPVQLNIGDAVDCMDTSGNDNRVIRLPLSLGRIPMETGASNTHPRKNEDNLIQRTTDLQYVATLSQ